MILAAGYGKRMHNLTHSIPKPLLKINNKELLRHNIDFFINLGCDKIIINTHYLHDKIQLCIDDHYSDRNIILSYEPTLLNTGGGIKNALSLLGNKNFIVTNSDILWEEENNQDVINFIKKMKLNNVIIIGQSMGADLGVLVSTKINDKIIGCIGIDGGAINLKQKFLIKKIALKALEPPNMEGIDKDVMLSRMRKHRKDWSEEAIQGQFSIFEVDNNNTKKKA